MNGFLIIDKPYGLSSYDVLRRLNKKFSLKRRSIKFGHGGTLDPLATGVLVVALGRATRMLQFFLSDTKSYRATICIGAQTTTDDAEGDIIRTAPYEHIDIEAIRSALADFRGKIWQTPPDYSAVHVDGARAYEVMRNGGHVEIDPKLVEIYDIDVVSYRTRPGQMPELVVDITCSGGTYIRSIARDLGKKLHSAASLRSLVRTRSCDISIDRAKSLDQICACDDIESMLIEPCEIFRSTPCLIVTPDDIDRLFKGKHVHFPFPPRTADVELYRVQMEDPGTIYAFVKLSQKMEITRMNPDGG